MNIWRKLKEILTKYPKLKMKLSYFFHYNYYYWKPKKIKSIEQILELFCSEQQNITFVQIGANDGVMHDLIHKFIIDYEWQGVLVEPISYLFERLKENYKNISNLRFENSAISDKSEKKDFYRLSNSTEFELPDWAAGLGSFKLEILLNNCSTIEGFSHKLILKEEYNCITFSQLIKKHKISEIDFLQTDTEGYDYEILKTIDFDKLKMKLILFEHCHLVEKDYKSLWKMLRINYTLLSENGDTIAIRKNLYKKIKEQIVFQE
jgi:FkbM family methyltransferase